jgi:hypothetical protein
MSMLIWSSSSPRARQVSRMGIDAMNKCQPSTLGIAIGVVWAFYVSCAGILAMFGWGTAAVETLGSFYLGYGPSVTGAIIGAIWAFVDGLVAGVIIAWIYDFVAK